jgi:hypothetical protein
MSSERNEDRIFNSSAVLRWNLDGREGSLLTTIRRKDTSKWAAGGRRVHVSCDISSTLQQNLPDSNFGGEIVAMKQTAEPRHRSNPMRNI